MLLCLAYLVPASDNVPTMKCVSRWSVLVLMILPLSTYLKFAPSGCPNFKMRKSWLVLSCLITLLRLAYLESALDTVPTLECASLIHFGFVLGTGICHWWLLYLWNAQILARSNDITTFGYCKLLLVAVRILKCVCLGWCWFGLMMLLRLGSLGSATGAVQAWSSHDPMTLLCLVYLGSTQWDCFNFRIRKFWLVLAWSDDAATSVNWNLCLVAVGTLKSVSSIENRVEMHFLILAIFWLRINGNWFMNLRDIKFLTNEFPVDFEGPESNN